MVWKLYNLVQNRNLNDESMSYGINQLLTTNKTWRYCTFIPPPLLLLLMTEAAESFPIALALTLVGGGYESAIAPKTLCASYLMCQ